MSNNNNGLYLNLELTLGVQVSYLRRKCREALDRAPTLWDLERPLRSNGDDFWLHTPYGAHYRLSS